LNIRNSNHREATGIGIVMTVPIVTNSGTYGGIDFPTRWGQQALSHRWDAEVIWYYSCHRDEPNSRSCNGQP
jgi:hypothetical protein